MAGSSMMSGGKGGGSTSNTTTSTSQPPQQVVDAYGALINRATQQSLTPYQSYQGQQVADLTPMQQQGFQNINNSQGMAQPYINQASTLANQSAQPVWQDIPKYNDANLAQYQSPYQQNVIDTTMANINQNNAIQQQQLMGHAISSGASPFGGDRAGVAAAELARNQNLASGQTIAGLENQGFQNSQQQFNLQQQLQLQGQNADAQRQAQASSLQGGLGLAAQGAALQGASAQLQGGTLQQAQNQAQLNVPYQNFLQQQAYPYQQLGWLGNLTEGLGSNMGGQSITSSPGASSQSQMMGLGMFGAGALGSFMGHKDGGSIKYAKGGSAEVYNPQDVITWIPEISLPISRTIPDAPKAQQADQSGGLGSMASLLGAGSGLGKMMGGSGSGSSGTDIGTSMPWLNGTGADSANTGTDLGSSMPWLESGSSAMDYSSMGGYASGGALPHYADGGLSIQPFYNTPTPVFNGISSSAPTNSNRDAQGNVISWIPMYPNESQTGSPAAGSAASKEKHPWQGAAAGAMSGAAMGTAIMPGYGTAIGAVGGGLLGYFANSKDGGAAYNQGGLVPHYEDGGLIDEENPDESGDTYQMAMEDIPAMGDTQRNAMGEANASSGYPSLAQAITPTPADAPMQMAEAGSQDITAENNPGLVVANANPQVEAPVQKPSYSQALMMAGLGTLAGNSPNTLQNVAHGGLQGFANYEGQKKAIVAAQKERQLEQHQQNMDAKPQIINDGKQYLAWYPHEKNSKTGLKGLAIPLGIPFSGSGVNEARIAMYNAQAEKAKKGPSVSSGATDAVVKQIMNDNPGMGYTDAYRVYKTGSADKNNPTKSKDSLADVKKKYAQNAPLATDILSNLDDIDALNKGQKFITGGMMPEARLEGNKALQYLKNKKYIKGETADNADVAADVGASMDKATNLLVNQLQAFQQVPGIRGSNMQLNQIKASKPGIGQPEKVNATITNQIRENVYNYLIDHEAAIKYQQENPGSDVTQGYKYADSLKQQFPFKTKDPQTGMDVYHPENVAKLRSIIQNPAQPAQLQSAALPEGIPAGSTLTGQSKGKDVYLTPDGKHLRVD